MSWETINAILAHATVDETFCQKLLENPSEAIRQQQFALMKEEEEKLSRIKARDLCEFSQHILVLFEQEERQNTPSYQNAKKELFDLIEGVCFLPRNSGPPCLDKVYPLPSEARIT